MNQLDLDWSSDGYHKLVVTWAYTYWQNNSLQALGMQLVDMGINAVASALGGLGGSAIGGLGQGTGILGGGTTISTDSNLATTQQATFDSEGNVTSASDPDAWGNG